MPKICYVENNFHRKSLLVIAKAEEICLEYVAQGYSLTLRQLYYQFVARGLIPNNIQEYKKLGSIINDARLAGYLDWDHIEDRTRNLEKLSTWESPKEILESCAEQFKFDYWKDQDYYIEVWVEKEALTRAGEYIAKWGNKSWELDALDPKIIDDLISKEIEKYIDWKKWNKMKEKEDNCKKQLAKMAKNWKD